MDEFEKNIDYQHKIRCITKISMDMVSTTRNLQISIYIPYFIEYLSKRNNNSNYYIELETFQKRKLTTFGMLDYPNESIMMGTCS